MAIQDNGYTITGHAGAKKIDVTWQGNYTEIMVHGDNGSKQSFDADGLDDYIQGLRYAFEKAKVMDRINAVNQAADN
jgi:hypothetical protein